MNILIPDTVFPDDHAIERAAAAPLDIVIENAQKAGELSAEVWSGADALVAHHLMPYDKIIAKAASNVRILVRVGVGVDNIDLDVWSACGVPVCNVPDYGTGEVADHALALTLSLLRGTVAYQGRIFDLLEDAEFDRMPIPAPVRRIAGLQCLAVGYGAIGRAFADRTRALGMTVGFFDPDIAPGSWEVPQVHRFSSLEAGLEVADVVSLHLPLTEKTSNIIDTVAFAAMKSDAVLINTARGGLVDTGAVADALQAGDLGGVGRYGCHRSDYGGHRDPVRGGGVRVSRRSDPRGVLSEPDVQIDLDIDGGCGPVHHHGAADHLRIGDLQPEPRVLRRVVGPDLLGHAVRSRSAGHAAVHVRYSADPRHVYGSAVDDAADSADFLSAGDKVRFRSDLVCRDCSVGDGNQLYHATFWPTSICNAGCLAAGDKFQRNLSGGDPLHGMRNAAGGAYRHLPRHRHVVAVARQLTLLDT